MAPQHIISQKGLIDIYVPDLVAHKPTREKLWEKYVDPIQNETVKNAVDVAVKAMDVSLASPVSPVGEILWTEHARAIDKAIYKEMTPKDALDAGNKVVQEELDKFWADFQTIQ